MKRVIVIFTRKRSSSQHLSQWPTRASQKTKMEICFLWNNRKRFTTLLSIFATQSNDHFLPVMSLKEIIIQEEFVPPPGIISYFSQCYDKISDKKQTLKYSSPCCGNYGGKAWEAGHTASKGRKQEGTRSAAHLLIQYQTLDRKTVPPTLRLDLSISVNII